MTDRLPEIDVDLEPISLAEWEQCRACFEWFASRLLYIKDKQRTTPHTFNLNAPQRHVMSMVRKYPNSMGGGSYLIYKARQEGMSTLIALLFSFWALSEPGFQAMIIAHENEATENLLSIVKRCYNNMPSSFMLGDKRIGVKPKEKVNRKNELLVYFDKEAKLESHIVVDRASAGGEAGISFANNALHFSEVGKRSFDDGKAIGASMQTLASNGVAFAEGTADGKNGWMYETWGEIEDDFEQFQIFQSTHPLARYDGWVPIFLPWYAHYSIPLLEGEVIEPQDDWERAVMQGEGTYKHYKVRPDQIKAMRFITKTRLPRTLEMSREKWRAQEYPSNPQEGFVATGVGYFDSDAVEHGEQFAKDFMRNHTLIRYSWNGKDFIKSPRHGEWWFIKEPEPNKYKYVIGGDVAEGLETGDYDVTAVEEVRADGPNWIVGFWRKHENEKFDHAQQINALATMVHSSATAIELNFHGKSVNDKLAELGCKGLYVQNVQDEGSFAAGYHKRYGWLTGGKTRGIMLGQLQEAVSRWHKDPNDKDGLVIPFPQIWREMAAFVTENRKAQGAKGTHDDCVMTVGITHNVAIDITPKINKDTVVEPKPDMQKWAQSIGLGKWAKTLKKLEKQRAAINT